MSNLSAENIAAEALQLHLKAWLIKATLNCCKSLWVPAWFRHTQPLDENLPEPTRVNDNDLYVKVMELPKSLA